MICAYNLKNKKSSINQELSKKKLEVEKQISILYFFPRFSCIMNIQKDMILINSPQVDKNISMYYSCKKIKY